MSERTISSVGEHVAELSRTLDGIDHTKVRQEIEYLMAGNRWQRYVSVTDYGLKEWQSFRLFVEDGLRVHVETLLDAVRMFPKVQARIADLAKSEAN